VHDGARERGAFLRWQWQRLKEGVPPDPPAEAFPIVASAVAQPRAARGEVRITWVGHATFLVQIGGFNVLTDPVWSARASPVQFAGPVRLAPPGLAWESLPPIDAVLVSHDHFDHLDRPTVNRLRRHFGPGLRWITPLGYADWFAARGIAPIVQLDWWQSARLSGPGGSLDIVALPAQHWTRRSILSDADRLWGSYAVLGEDGSRLYFAGDSGYFGGFRQIGEQLGPFDVALLPIGAYEPRWFMAAAHMNPEEAVRAYQDLGGRGLFGGMHWGTFRLTDEPPLEPPTRTRTAWVQAGFPAESLWIPRHGETRVLPLAHAQPVDAEGSRIAGTGRAETTGANEPRITGAG
jgi:L-ascorbate metabolism protein UlaG (beta-lactamase superfamily)